MSYPQHNCLQVGVGSEYDQIFPYLDGNLCSFPQDSTRLFWRIYTRWIVFHEIVVLGNIPEQQLIVGWVGSCRRMQGKGNITSKNTFPTQRFAWVLGFRSQIVQMAILRDAAQSNLRLLVSSIRLRYVEHFAVQVYCFG